VEWEKVVKRFPRTVHGTLEATAEHSAPTEDDEDEGTEGTRVGGRVLRKRK
jgi:hypothetical protein